MIITEHEVDIMVQKLLSEMKIKAPPDWRGVDDIQFIEDTKFAFISALKKCKKLRFPSGQEKYI